ncbi:MAG TPA: hypothetical protein VGC32_07570 [Solirubrobacterales bacterium]
MLLLAAVAGATPPQKGARYGGLIVVQHFPGQDVEFPLSFTVDPTGRELGSISFPHGAPFGIDCQQGPLGEPASEGRHVGVEGGGINVTFPLEFLFEGAETSGQPNLGTVHLEGSFRPHGVFVGSLDNRTPIKACRGSWNFKLRAQSR